ncbi:MAG: PqqD family protein [Lachnospiraceae bacterium]|nr:PqqD family protein [Lachnospiraceae bacterium]
MKRNNSFYIKNIAGKKYIVPYAQMLADMFSGVKINETGEYIWNLLEKDKEKDELIEKCCEYYETSGDECETVKKDVSEFIKMLFSYGMIINGKMFSEKNDLIKRISIAGIKIGLYGDGECLRDDFDAFEIKRSDDENKADCGGDDLRIEILHSLSPVYENGREIIRNAVVDTVECEDRYVLTFSESDEIIECQINKEGTLAKIYTQSNLSDEGKEILFHAIRHVFLYRALMEGIPAVHSVSILYNNKAWLFSASSGTGKSTHAELWKKLYATEFINGDLNLIGCSNNKAYIYGLPWCGTSGICNTGKYEIGGIFLLRRSERNYVEELSEDEKRLLVQQRIVSPSWNTDLVDRQFETVDAVCDKIMTARLYCTKDDEAAKVLKEYIDTKSQTEAV